MRKTIVMLGLVAAGCSQAGLPTQPDAAVEAAATAGSVTVRGEAVTALGAVATRTLRFNATRAPNGRVTGTYLVRRSDNGAWFRGRATCLTIVGDTVWLGGITAETNVPNLVRVNTVSYFYAIDKGNGTPPDQVGAVRLNDVEGQDGVFCRDRPVQLGFNNLVDGDIVVP